MAEQERRYDKHGAVVKLAPRDARYVMVRRPGAAPFILSVKEWESLPTEPAHPAPEERTK